MNSFVSVWMIKSTVYWVKYVELLGKHGKRQSQKSGFRWKDTIKMVLREVCCEELFELDLTVSRMVGFCDYSNKSLVSITIGNP
jgi:hypothetical protein